MNYEPKKFACTHCGQHVEADVSFAGQTVSCPCCQQPMRIPQRQHFLATKPQGGGGRRLAVWTVTILAALAGGWYLAARQGWAPWISPLMSTTTIEGKVYPARIATPREIATLVRRALDPPGLGDLKRSSRFTLTVSGNSHAFAVEPSYFETGVKRDDAGLRSIMGEPSRIVQDGTDLASPDPASPYQMHYYYRTNPKSEMVVVVSLANSKATGVSVAGSGDDMTQFNLQGFIERPPAKAK